MANPCLIKNYSAGAAIAPNLLVKPGANPGEVIPAAAATDAVLGISVPLVSADSGGRVDVVHSGIAEALAGGTVAFGDPITSDTDGKAVKAAPASGANNRVVGTALAAAAAGDLFPVLVNPSQIQGA